MLVLKERTDQGEVPVKFFIVDVHHHVGREEKVKNLNPSGPDGSFIFLKSVFWGNQWKAGLIKQMEDDPDEFHYSIPEDKLITEPHPCVAGSMALDFQPFGLDVPQMFKDTFLSDIIVAFPMNDVFKDKEVAVYSEAGEPTPLYAYSNNKAADITSKFPNSLRMVPFGRVVPTQDNALKEMVRAVDGLEVKGFKLHPKSDGYPMSDDVVVDALVTAAGLDVPALFHTSFISEAEDLRSAVNRAIVKMYKEEFKGDEAYKDLGAEGKKNFRELIRSVNSLRVIIGHCGWHTSPELFDILKHPCIYGDISGIKGDVVRRFFATAQQCMGYDYDNSHGFKELEDGGISRENIELMFPSPRTLPDYRGWSKKILFGTDFPFLDQNQAIDVFKGVLSTEFPGTSRDAANFLGLNSLKLLFPHNISRGSETSGPADLFKDVLTRHGNLKKAQVNISYVPRFLSYPCAAVGDGFDLNVQTDEGAAEHYSWL